jgi:anti-anti-sigma factor
MPARSAATFYVEISDRTLLLRGELDMATVQDLQSKIDEFMVPGHPIILDLAQLTFMSSSVIHCFNKAAAESGHPVVLRNTSRVVRRILDVMGSEPKAWVLDGEGAFG